MSNKLCLGSGCLLSLKCKRYIPLPIDNTEYFTDAPYRVINGKTECNMFWGDIQSNIFGQLKEITNDSNGNKGDDIGGVEEKEQTT